MNDREPANIPATLDGTGVGTAWLLAGMDANSRLTSVDSDPKVLEIRASSSRTRLSCDVSPRGRCDVSRTLGPAACRSHRRQVSELPDGAFGITLTGKSLTSWEGEACASRARVRSRFRSRSGRRPGSDPTRR